jgi:molybdate transport system substrate-binding protein
MKTAVLLFLFMVGTLHAGEINIALAANVSYAIDELKAEFAKKHPDTKIRVTLGSSGKLTAQIRNGAPYGLFMAANMKYPQALYDDRIAITQPLVYAQGALAYFSLKKQDFSKGIDLLKDEKNYKIAIANPKTAPYGKAAVEAMKNSGIYEDIKSKLVFAESISQTVSYAVTATEVGIIAKSSLYSSKMIQYKENLHWASLDTSLYTPIDQGVVLLKYSENAQEYKAFYDFVLGDEAKGILKKYGYIVK